MPKKKRLVPTLVITILFSGMLLAFSNEVEGEDEGYRILQIEKTNFNISETGLTVESGNEK
jgi:hypothetical protein